MNDALRRELDDATFFAELAETRPHLFSDSPVFLPKHDLDSMLAIVRAVEAASRVETYRDAVAAWAPAIAQHDFGPRGAFMGYDFHLGDEGPKLIEINTNAGGAFLKPSWGAKRLLRGGGAGAGRPAD